MSKNFVFSLSFQAAEAKLGGIDYLVLNHILNIDMGEWQGSSLNLTLLQSILDVNFNAYVHLASHALPALEKSGGSIIIMSSLAGEYGCKLCHVI